ncbi:hypothetical protein [Roseobacter sinensis]|uniref:Uncharacterized protein n=1 Tax=Roseobacter sinensis TaxID=2931391 RepID=A0ABT3BDV3_9RHOB|nr:hypothetical protein [Roseobacter sp. WL0113]MCV3271319.1 hypothetical protein [Roseobacter sp. WL0113]
MILEQDYARILANVSPHTPRDLDPSLFGAGAKAESGGFDPAMRAPATALWTLSDKRISRVGIRIRAPLDDPAFVASRLAAIAVERRVLPIFLSHTAASEMLRFGFRVEHVSGATAEERAVCEEQIKRFWKIAMIVDAADVEKLG